MGSVEVDLFAFKWHPDADITLPISINGELAGSVHIKTHSEDPEHDAFLAAEAKRKADDAARILAEEMAEAARQAEIARMEVAQQAEARRLAEEARRKAEEEARPPVQPAPPPKPRADYATCADYATLVARDFNDGLKMKLLANWEGDHPSGVAIRINPDGKMFAVAFAIKRNEGFMVHDDGRVYAGPVNPFTPHPLPPLRTTKNMAAVYFYYNYFNFSSCVHAFLVATGARASHVCEVSPCHH